MPKFKSLLQEGQPFAVVSTDYSMDGRKYTKKDLKNMVETKSYLGNKPYIAKGHDGIYGGGKEESYGLINPDSIELRGSTLYVTPEWVDDSLIRDIEDGKFQGESIESTWINFSHIQLYDIEGNEIEEREGLFKWRNKDFYEAYGLDANLYDKDGNLLNGDDIFKDYLLGFAVLGRVTPNYPQFKLSELIKTNSINDLIGNTKLSNNLFIFERKFIKEVNMPTAEKIVEEKSNINNQQIDLVDNITTNKVTNTKIVDQLRTVKDDDIDFYKEQIETLQREKEDYKLQIERRNSELSESRKRYNDLLVEYNKHKFLYEVWENNKKRGAITYSDIEPYDEGALYDVSKQIEKLNDIDKVIEGQKLIKEMVCKSKCFDDFNSSSVEDQEKIIRIFARKQGKIPERFKAIEKKASQYHEIDEDIDIHTKNKSREEIIYKKAMELMNQDAQKNIYNKTFNQYRIEAMQQIGGK